MNAALATTAEISTLQRTFLFTDIEGSTQLWDRFPAAMRAELARHDAILRAAADDHQGFVFKTIGDAFCIAFEQPAQAVRAALQAQRALGTADWGVVGAIKVRMAIHGGIVEARDRDFFGPPLNRVARLRDAGHGGQALVSAWVRDALTLENHLPEGVDLLDQGEHALKDLAQAEHIYQLRAPGLADGFPVLRTLSEKNNLPASGTQFVGREAEVAAVRALLGARGGARLVNLTGLGGSGKTRLALEIAEETLAEYADGVWFADLAPLSDASLVFPTLARACGLDEEPARTALQQLSDHFRRARALVVLDNFEHVEEAADDVAVLLKNCPQIQVLVTSRTLLNLSMEYEYPVPPLDTGASVSLFAARARQVRPDFAANDENRLDLETLCAQLDGIPLAVELAAAQVRFLSPREIGQALDHRLQVLSTKMRDLPPRHRSLRGAIDGSYDLLSREEQALFRALSVFVGGFTPEAVAAVCRPVCRSQSEALLLLSDLRDKSLVRLEREGDRRYMLNESLRQYGEERLEQYDAALLADLRERHAAFFLDLAEQQAPLLQGAGQVAALNLLETEAANLRAAMNDRLNNARWDESARFGVALRRFWQLRGRLREGRDLLSRVADHAGDVAGAGLRARLLFAAGFSHLYGSEPARAVPFYEESLRLAEESDDLPVLGQSLNGLGGVAHRRGELDRAEDYYRRAETVERRQSNDRGVALTLNNQGLIAVARGDYERAGQLYAESLLIRERQGDQVSQAQLWNHLGAVAQVLERFDEARNAFERSLALSDAVGDADGKACTLTNKGHLALHQNALDEAEQNYRAALDILRGGDDRANVAECLTSLGVVFARRGNFATAARLCGEGLVLHRDAGSREGVAATLEALAEIAQAGGQPALCFVLLTAAGSLHAETGARRLPQEADRLARLDQAARAALPDSPPPPTTDLPEVLRLALALVQELARTDEENPHAASSLRTADPVA